MKYKVQRDALVALIKFGIVPFFICTGRQDKVKIINSTLKSILEGPRC